MPQDLTAVAPPFRITQGGLSYRVEVRLALEKPDRPKIPRRAALSILLTWFPLLVLSAFEGNATGQHVAVSFLRDFAVHTRFLFAVPLLILAESIIGPRLEAAAAYFLDSKLVVGDDIPRFATAVQRALHLRDSVLAEVVLLLLSYAGAIAGLLSVGVHVSTWYSGKPGVPFGLTIAGWWFVLLSVPLMHFLALRWLWWMFLWTQFLWRMSRLNLRLDPLHPDGSGGLTFVGNTERFFGILLFALSTAVSGVLADAIIYDQIPLTGFGYAIAIYVALTVCVTLSPLLVFYDPLFRTKAAGLYQYGTLATEYTRSFRRKWMSHPRQTDETLLGTGDIQSLADLGNSYSFIDRMNYLPMTMRTLIDLVLSCLSPIAPLLLTMMPLSEILKTMMKLML